MLILPATTIVSSLVQTSLYDRIITNVSKTNDLNQIVANGVSNAVWDIVAGNNSFTDGTQYAVIDSIKKGIENIRKTTISRENRRLLDVALRTLDTLTSYVDRLGNQMGANSGVADNEKILDEIRAVSSLMSDILQDYIMLELESVARANERIKVTVIVLTAMECVVLVCVTLFAYYAQRSVSRSINKPIKELERLSADIASGNLESRAALPGVDELDNLTANLNFMAQQIRELIEANVIEQKNLQKAEMKALQSQITPHFLYNTFDTIIWLAEACKTDEVIDVTRAFSSFFRVSLSRGREWITVSEEMEHVRSYLIIQKIRYRDILDYSIDVDDDVLERKMLKLLLQPLVENALYHGIKNKRGKGRIEIKGSRSGSGMRFTVTDNGCGMDAERLAHVLEQIDPSYASEELSDVYGLYSVTRRLRLYYGEEASISIESEWQKGTVVGLFLPEV